MSQRRSKRYPNEVPTEPPPGKLFIDRREVAWLLGVSVRFVDSLVSAGKIPSRRVGNVRKFERARLTEWFRKGVRG